MLAMLFSPAITALWSGSALSTSPTAPSRPSHFGPRPHSLAALLLLTTTQRPSGSGRACPNTVAGMAALRWGREYRAPRPTDRPWTSPSGSRHLRVVHEGPRTRSLQPQTVPCCLRLQSSRRISAGRCSIPESGHRRTRRPARLAGPGQHWSTTSRMPTSSCSAARLTVAPRRTIRGPGSSRNATAARTESVFNNSPYRMQGDGQDHWS